MRFTVSDFPAKGNELSVDEIVTLCQLSESVGFDRFGVTDFPFHFDCVALMIVCLRATDFIEVESLVICRQMWRGEIPTIEGEVADIVHIASPYLGRIYKRQNIELIANGAQRDGRAMGDFEIDLSVSLCASRESEEARRLGKLTTGAAIPWMAGADEFGRKRTDWQRPPDFSVPDDVVEALATKWDMWSGEIMSPEVEALITDEILDQFTVAGTPEECVAPLLSLAHHLPRVTGFRFKLPPITGAGSFERFREVISSAGDVVAAVRSIEAA